MKKKPEVLAPAGNMECLKAALRFGADAVYLAGTEFGMRSAPANFTMEQLAEGCSLAHAQGVRVYLTCNTIPRCDELERLPAFLRGAQEAGVDAFIITDLGVMELAKRHAPGVELHISTQAGVANWASANVLHSFGAARVVLARELSLAEIAELRAHTPPELEIEAFVHGAMCMSFSGRCLLSNYLTGRDANRGDCAQPCRWKYALVEEKRPGQYMEIQTAKEGSYILNSRDMCMIEHIPELVQAGVTSLKMEGRAKSPYYVSVITNAYRRAVDWYFDHPGEPLPGWIVRETEAISHRPYSTGFYFGSEPGQETVDGGYVRDCEVIALCDGRENGEILLTQKNRFFRGDVADVLEPGREPYLLPLDDIFDADGLPITSAPHPAMRVRLRTNVPVSPGAILRRWACSDT